MSDPLQVNLTGRVMMLSRRFGIVQPARVAVFARAIEEVVWHVYPGGRPSLLAMEPLISEQLVLLESALAALRANAVPTVSAKVFPEEEQEQIEEALQEDEVETPIRRRRRPLKGDSAVGSRSMEEKLREERKPVKKLIEEDCVRVGLVDKKGAARMIRSMIGKKPEDAEEAIVEELRQILQDHVKKTIRRLKGGPWSSPQAQEDMRKDIHRARSVKSILMLNRQIAKERHSWEEKHGKGGMLGMFAARSRLSR